MPFTPTPIVSWLIKSSVSAQKARLTLWENKLSGFAKREYASKTATVSISISAPVQMLLAIAVSFSPFR